LPKLRISVVQYLNTFPLVWGFTHGPLAGKYDLSFTVPSQCAEALRAGDVDIAIIPAIEYQRIDDLVILPDLAIASKRRVRSLLLISKVPIAPAGSVGARELREGPRSIALDRSSRSTQALTKILCARHWQIAPQFREMAPDLAEMLAANDAALLIGDPALRVSLAIESAPALPTDFVGAGLAPPARSAASNRSESTPPLGSAGTPAGGFSSPSTHSQPAPSASPGPCPAPEICDAATLGLSSSTLSQTLTKEGPKEGRARIATPEKLYVYDIVAEWRAMTGLSAVLAVWAARPAVATPEVVADFHASRAFGLLNLPELCDEAAAQLQLPAPALHSYLTDNIDFTLDPENVAALTKYFAEAAALHLAPAAKPVHLAPGPNPLVLEPALTAVAKRQ
jgi:predicted solute-binding protein